MTPPPAPAVDRHRRCAVSRAPCRMPARRLAALLLAPAMVASAACGGPPPATVHDGPIVVVTLGGVRADSVGFLAGGPAGLTPHLDALAARAEWAGAAVAPSSVGLVSLATFATGVGPWVHGVGRGEHPLELPPELRTLAEALGERGFRSAGYAPNWIVRAGGWGQGFGFLRDIAGGGRAEGHVASLEARRDFLWIHLGAAEAPWTRDDRFAARLGLSAERLAELPASLSQADLELLRDPAAAAGGGARAALALYRLSLAAVDRQLGELLAALDASGQRDSTLLVVASTHGQELAEPPGWGLAREHIEVPLVIDLPLALAAGRTAPAAEARPPAAALWATVAELAGVAVPPAVPPGLLAPPSAPHPSGALSELYLGNGVNETSWVEGGHQLLRRVPFVAGDAPVGAVRRARVGLDPGSADDPGRLLARFEREFASAPAWAGRGPAENVLLAWRAGGSVVVEDPPRRRRMAVAMERRRHAFVPCDETPAAAAARRAAERSAAGAG